MALVKMDCVPRSVTGFLCDLEKNPSAPDPSTVRRILQPFLFLAVPFLALRAEKGSLLQSAKQ